MRRCLLLTAMLLPLGGCYLQPMSGYGYAQPGYPAPGYPAPGYQGADDIYPGYAYNEGAPYMMTEGAAVPLILFGGVWGYHDHYGQFRRAPDPVWRHLERQHPRGFGLRRFEEHAAPRFGGGAASQPAFRHSPPATFHQSTPQATPQAAHQAPAAPPARGQAPQREEHRRNEDRRCPAGQTRC